MSETNKQSLEEKFQTIIETVDVANAMAARNAAQAAA